MFRVKAFKEKSKDFLFFLLYVGLARFLSPYRL